MKVRPKRAPVTYDRSHLRNAQVSLRLTVAEFAELDKDASSEARGMGFIAYRRYLIGLNAEKAAAQGATS